MKKRGFLLIITILNISFYINEVLNFNLLQAPSLNRYHYYLGLLFWVSLAIYSHYKGKSIIVTCLLLVPIPYIYVQSFLIRYILANFDISNMELFISIQRILYSIIIIIILYINNKHNKSFIYSTIIIFQLIFVSTIFFSVPYIIQQVIFIIRQLTILFILIFELKKNYNSELISAKLE